MVNQTVLIVGGFLVSFVVGLISGAWYTRRVEELEIRRLMNDVEVTPTTNLILPAAKSNSLGLGVLTSSKPDDNENFKLPEMQTQVEPKD